MKQIPFEVLTHAENALTASEEAIAVLHLWIDSMPDDEQHHAEACRVGAVMSLVLKGVSELLKAQDVYKLNTEI